jgi:hypothetical protein
LAIEEWFVHDSKDQHGPFEPAELRARLAGYPSIESVFVWREGLQDWKPAAEVVEIDAPAEDSNRRFSNFIARNWRGEFPLWIAYWVFGLAGNIAIAVIPLAMAGVIRSKTGFHPTYLFSLIVAIWISIVAVSVWQWVGVWRSANRAIEQRRHQLRKAPWARIAKLMTIIAFLQLALALVNAAAPQIAEMSRIAFLDDPEVPKYFLRVMRNGTEAEITGGIKFGLAADFTKMLRAARQIRVVHLNSIGGRIGEGEALYNIIKDNHLVTYVSQRCLSACTLAFSAGRERVLGHGAVLGFHRGTFAGEDQKDSLELEGQRKIFTAAGFAPQFIVRALATPSSDMWTPSATELIDAGVITRVSNGSDYAYSGFPPGLSKAYFFDSLAKSADVYAAIRDRLPKRYDEMVATFHQAVIDGKTETETVIEIQRQLGVILAELRRSAADDVLVDFSNLYADQFTWLQQQSPSACYQFGRTGMRAADYPKELGARELDIEARLVRTAAAKPDTREPSPELWKKFYKRLSVRGVSKADIDMLGRDDLGDVQQARYCAAMIALFKEIAALPPAEAAQVIKSVLAAK